MSKMGLDMKYGLYVYISLLLIYPLAVCWTAEEIEDSDPNEDNLFTAETSPLEIGVGGNLRRENPIQSEKEGKWPLHLNLLWESRYVSEGRDNLDGDSLASLTSDFSIGNFTFAPWLARSPDTDFTELNLNFAYGLQVADELELYGSYTYLHARLEDEDGYDNEVSLALVYMPTVLFDLMASYDYSFDAKGGFAELSLLRQHLVHEQVVLTLRSTLGMNNGYIVEGHNGLNHIQLHARLAYYPMPRLEIMPYAAYNIAINRDSNRYVEDLQLRNFFWGGLGVAFHF